MEVTVFQSAQGDCLLLSDTGDRTRILVDGGMPASYTAHVAPTLTKFRKARKKNIDLVYVSHIDRDHIGGVLKMLDDEVLWRVHEHQKRSGNARHKAPKGLRPPVIRAIWHNSFHDQLRRNSRPIEEALAASAPVLSASELQAVREAGRQQAGLVSSIREAMRVSKRIGSRQLKIPLNGAANGKLLILRPGQGPIKLGQFRITILGPTAAHLANLRKEWNTWLENSKNKKAVEDLRKVARADETRLGASDFEHLFAMMALQAEAFGDPESVTPPNLASLTLFVEEGGKSILLTGDARWDQIIEGLEATGRLEPGRQLVVDIVKVPHHGSENNVVETTLLDRTVGRHYVFCGNGHSANPEIEVVELMAKHRLKAPGRFKFWFNSSEAVVEDGELAGHMREVERTVRRLATHSGGRMSFRFLERGSSVRVI
jgi:beta-lactamase superfamily II metal-dependent hydrolase